ncbi:hypothetical protein BDY19DRAFT_897145 [Irpex rosettiformis]|uniref:Uncharacterized protein n=1 Tax=Irpex rosettiformis TaxID=378272 RepID=A0ACB8TSV7_9APHY|nr:hypothetical protein BDY19DRAFT_897145 [Irpex rosettiformis]
MSSFVVISPSSSENALHEEVLPAYLSSHPPPTPQPQLVTHSYSLTHKDGRAWLKLRIQSKAASSDQLPIVIGDQTVHGTVDFEPKDGASPKAIVVTLVGELISETNMRFSFVEDFQQLWPEAQDNAPSAAPIGKHSTSRVLPFALRLPQTVDALAEDNSTKSFKLPAPDFARFRRYTVVYTLRVKVKYSSIFSTNHVSTCVNYMPVIQPSSPSVLRQDAYALQAPLPPPDVDPEGWHSLPSVTFEGKLFGDRMIAIHYTLSLAAPLTYVRGSVIPLHLLVECSDTHGLDLASGPSTPLVRFRRISHINYDAGGANMPATQAKLSDLKPMPMTAFQDLVDWLNTATWWSTPCEKSGVRMLQGEIHIRKNLRPSAHLGLYKLSYDVALFDPVIPGFVLTIGQKNKALQSVEVEVATVYPSGPRPIAYSPPSYEEENANQPVETRNTRFNHFSKNMFL